MEQIWGILMNYKFILMKIIFISLFFSIGYSSILHVPGDFSAIQGGIDAAMDGDTILVEQGIYYENLVIQKSITLASWAIFDDMSSWIEYNGEYSIANEYIANTIIDGSLGTNGEDLKSVISIIEPVNRICIEPQIFGFTITGGEGTTVSEIIDGPSGPEAIENVYGGGIFISNAIPKLNYNKIHSNGGTAASLGGGIFLSNQEYSDPRMERDCEGEYDFSHNFYKDNNAVFGKTLTSYYLHDSQIDMSNSVFDVYNCSEDDVSQHWVYLDAMENDVTVDFSNGVGDLCSISVDVWVSPNGNDTGSGTDPADPPPITINPRLFDITMTINRISIYFHYKKFRNCSIFIEIVNVINDKQKI